MAGLVNNERLVVETAEMLVDKLKARNIRYTEIISMVLTQKSGAALVLSYYDQHTADYVRFIKEEAAVLNIGFIATHADELHVTGDFRFEHDNYRQFNFQTFGQRLRDVAYARKYEVARAEFENETGSELASFLKTAKVNCAPGKILVALDRPLTRANGEVLVIAIRSVLDNSEKPRENGMNNILINSVKVTGTISPVIEVEYKFTKSMRHDKVEGFFHSFKAAEAVQNIAHGVAII